MKKIILLLIIFPIWVNAKSIISSSINEQGYYTNYNGVEISQEVYTKIKNKLSEEEIEEITPTLYEELESSVEIKNVNLPYQPDYNVTLFYLHNNDRKNILTKEKYNYFNIKEKDSKINYQNYLDNLYLEIKFVDYYNNTFVNETIKLKFTIDTNKKEKTNLNLKQIYLLQNNDYKSENYSCFVKKNTNTIFEYNFQNNYLKYEKKENNIKIYGMYNYLNKHFKYVVLNNYNIVETYDSKNVKEENPKYYFEVITPLEKEISIKKISY